MECQYVLVCQGPHCKVQGSKDVRDKLRDMLAGGAKGPMRTASFVLSHDCFDRCGRGPNVVIYPDGIWYEGIEPEDVPAIVEQMYGGPVPERLRANVGQDHAEKYYRLFEEVLPEFAAELKQNPTVSRRRWWRF